MIRRNYLTIFLLSALPFAVTLAQPKDKYFYEDALYEKLLDISALVRAGISLNDYKALLPELTILLDRYNRNGGTESSLKYAAQGYIDAVDSWHRLNEIRVKRIQDAALGVDESYAKLEASAEKVLQITWNGVTKQLDYYASQKTQRIKENKPRLRR